MNDISAQEIHDELFNLALALEEMIIAQEGKMPMRYVDLQKSSGYHEVRKRVLNDARAQLRRAKTFMLRAGTLKPRASEPTAQGEYKANAEKVERPKPEAQHLDWPKEPSKLQKFLAFLNAKKTGDQK